MNTEQMRAEFERWYSDDWENPKAVGRGGDGHYLLAGAFSAWEAWQAAYAAGQRAAVPEVDDAMIERAAKAYTNWFADRREGGINTVALRHALTAAMPAAAPTDAAQERDDAAI